VADQPEEDRPGDDRVGIDPEHDRLFGMPKAEVQRVRFPSGFAAQQEPADVLRLVHGGSRFDRRLVRGAVFYDIDGAGRGVVGDRLVDRPDAITDEACFVPCRTMMPTGGKRS
jgi:hypothetical protein